MSAPTVLRRSGSAAVVLGLVGLGLAAGLAFGVPAHATGSTTIQVKMAGQTAFSNTAPTPLLDVSDLAPGGSVSGAMQVRDASDTDAGSGVEDTLILTMVNVQAGDECPGGGATCDGSGESLADALQFTVYVTDPSTGATILQSPESLASLQDGVTLASNLAGGSVIAVQLTAALPREVGNGLQYGALGFDLQLGLITVAGESSSTASGTSTSAGSDPGSSGSTSGPETGTPSDVLVIGKDGDSLSYTGVPVAVLAAIAAALLAAGFVLLVLGRWRRRLRDPL